MSFEFMKYKLWSAICLLMLFVSSKESLAQENWNYRSKLQTPIHGGYKFPLIGMKQLGPTDYLIDYDNNAFYVQPVSLTWFAFKNLGLEVHYQTMFSREVNNHHMKFHEAME